MNDHKEISQLLQEVASFDGTKQLMEDAVAKDDKSNKIMSIVRSNGFASNLTTVEAKRTGIYHVTTTQLEIDYDDWKRCVSKLKALGLAPLVMVPGKFGGKVGIIFVLYELEMGDYRDK